MTDRALVRALSPWVRSLGRTTWGAPLLRATYVGAARVAAGALARIPGVTAVLATGSITRPEALEPGASDIDLVLVVDVPTVDAELALRSRVRRVHRALHGAAPVFTNLDYVEARDLDLLRAFGTIWSVDLDERFACLAGRDPRTRPGPVLRPDAEIAMEHTVHSVKRWMRASGFLLDPRVREAQKPRVLRRLLADLLARSLGRDRLAPLRDLLLAAREQVGAGLAGRLPLSTEPPLELGLAAALEATDRCVTSISAAWTGSFRVETEAARLDPSPDARSFAAAAAREGLAAGLVPRGPEGSGAIALALAPEGDAPLDVVRRASRLIGRTEPLTDPMFDWLGRPAVVPAAWLRSAALWGNAPLGGAAVAGSSVWLAGAPGHLPVAPPDDVIRALVRARMMKLFVRRVARTARDAQAFERELAFEARSLQPALSHTLQTGAFRLSARGSSSASPCGTERERVAALGEWLAEQRTLLGTELARRRRG